MADPVDVLDYWIGELGPVGWYAGGDAIDAACRDRFAELWQAAAEGGLDHWVEGTVGTLGSNHQTVPPSAVAASNAFRLNCQGGASPHQRHAAKIAANTSTPVAASRLRHPASFSESFTIPTGLENGRQRIARSRVISVGERTPRSHVPTVLVRQSSRSAGCERVSAPVGSGRSNIRASLLA